MGNHRLPQVGSDPQATGSRNQQRGRDDTPSVRGDSQLYALVSVSGGFPEGPMPGGVKGEGTSRREEPGGTITNTNF